MYLHYPLKKIMKKYKHFCFFDLIYCIYNYFVIYLQYKQMVYIFLLFSTIIEFWYFLKRLEIFRNYLWLCPKQNTKLHCGILLVKNIFGNKCFLTWNCNKINLSYFYFSYYIMFFVKNSQRYIKIYIFRNSLLDYIVSSQKYNTVCQSSLSWHDRWSGFHTTGTFE